MPHAFRVLSTLLRQPTPRASQPMQFRLQLWALTAIVMLLATIMDSPGGHQAAAAAQQGPGPASGSGAAAAPPDHAAREHLGSLDGWSLARSGRVYTPLSLSPLLVYTRVVGQRLSVRVDGVAAAGAAELTGAPATSLQPLCNLSAPSCTIENVPSAPSLPSQRNPPQHPRRTRAAPAPHPRRTRAAPAPHPRRTRAAPARHTRCRLVARGRPATALEPLL
jgi:hypothetical protein